MQAGFSHSRIAVPLPSTRTPVATFDRVVKIINQREKTRTSSDSHWEKSAARVVVVVVVVQTKPTRKIIVDERSQARITSIMPAKWTVGRREIRRLHSGVRALPTPSFVRDGPDVGANAE